MAHALHGDYYDYSYVVYNSHARTVVISCKYHGKFIQTPYDHVYHDIPCYLCRNIKLSNQHIQIMSGEYDCSDVLIRQPKYTKKIHQFSDSKQQFIFKAKVVHGSKYDYSKVVYSNSKTPVTILCYIHGEFEKTPNAHVSAKRGCNKCRKGEPGSPRTPAEFFNY